MIGQIKTTKGYSHDYILWAEPWQLMHLEAADAPRRVKKKKEMIVAESADDLDNLTNTQIL